MKVKESVNGDDTWPRFRIFSKSGLKCITSLGLLIAAWFLLTACRQERGPTVRIIVPDGFKGPIKIAETRRGTDINVEKGEYVYRIPTNGVLTVRNAAGFAQPHYEEAYWASGTSLPIYPLDAAENVATNAVLYFIGRSQSGLRFFLGTHKEMMEYIKAPPG
jgi:hypothetical protein